MMEDPSAWPLIWEDDFEGAAGASPDPARWTCQTGGSGWGNEEWQYYTSRPENVALDGSSALVITARQENSAGYECWYGPCRYTSGRLATREKFEITYGRVEARIRIPAGQGMWPAFWMLGTDFYSAGWPQCGEIDIMENIGREPRTVHGTVHGPGYSGVQGIGGTFTINQDLADAYHVFGVTWQPELIRWTMDDQEYHRVTPELLRGKRWVYDHAHFILLNLAVGGRWPGYPDDTTVFPQAMYVDWVRVFQQSG